MTSQKTAAKEIRYQHESRENFVLGQYCFKRMQGSPKQVTIAINLYILLKTGSLDNAIREFSLA